MGSMLHETVGAQRCFDELNSTGPEAVFRVHQSYIEAGAQIIETNTFGAHRFKTEPLGLGDEVQRLNGRGVKIAREARDAATREVLIAGSIGPLGIGVQARHPEPDEILAIFREQALALEERGVDLFILETFSYIEEVLLAIDAIRFFSGLPIVAQLTYSEEGTIFGDLRPGAVAALLKNKNVQIIGANCTLGPQSLLPILQELAGVNDLRISGMPNAGFPKREGDRIVYPKSSPEYFSLFAREAAALGGRTRGARRGNCSAPPHARLQHHRPASHAARRVDGGRRSQCSGYHRRSAFGWRLPGNQWRVRSRFRRPGKSSESAQPGHRLGRQDSRRSHQFCHRRRRSSRCRR